MASCPECKEQIPDSASECPHCGKKVIPADTLEKVPSKTSGWQKIVIAVSIVILIAIGFTFQGAEDREDKAAQNIFNDSIAAITKDVSARTGLAATYGTPVYSLNAKPKSAEVFVEFPKGPLSQDQAAVFAQGICGLLAKAYVSKGYMPRHITVHISSKTPDGKRLNYGQAIYNGNIDALGWEAASPNN